MSDGAVNSGSVSPLAAEVETALLEDFEAWEAARAADPQTAQDALVWLAEQNGVDPYAFTIAELGVVDPCPGSFAELARLADVPLSYDDQVEVLVALRRHGAALAAMQTAALARLERHGDREAARRAITTLARRPFVDGESLLPLPSLSAGLAVLDAAVTVEGTGSVARSGPGDAILASAADVLGSAMASDDPTRDSAFRRVAGLLDVKAGTLRAGYEEARRTSRELAAAEVSLALCLPPVTAQQKLFEARDLHDRLPATVAACARGEMTQRQARVMWDQTHHIADPEQIARIEAELLPKAEGQTGAQFARRVRRVIARLCPKEEAQAHVDAMTDRRVVPSDGEHGMGTLWASIPTDGLALLWTALNAISDRDRARERGNRAARRAAPKASESSSTVENDGHTRGCIGYGIENGCPGCVAGLRTADQRRADALVELASFYLQHAELPLAHGMKPTVQVTVAASTLLGLDDLPGDVEGHGPVPAEVARRVAADPTGTWRRLLTDPVSGALLDCGTATYRPPADLARHVITRDRTCSFPTCNQPARRCDLDHVLRFPDGATSSCNLTPLCRRHHRLKHSTGWTLIRTDQPPEPPREPTHAADPPREEPAVEPLPRYTWTTPSGRQYHHDPPPF